MTEPVVKDVQEQLLKDRKHKRRPGEVAYPLVYTHDLMDFDNWNHLYFAHLFRRLTVTDFSSPPSKVLDLGCGGGFWAISAAQEWTDSVIVGFDIQPVQPRLEGISAYTDIAKRIQWVHGNFLEKLPFPSSHFDYVRLVEIGLGVPEDEWQDLLEEVHRILKPGGTLEVLEDDLIFPCGPLPGRSAPPNPVILPMTHTVSSCDASSRSFSTARSSTLFEPDTPSPSEARSGSKHTSTDSQNTLSTRLSKSLGRDCMNEARDHSKVKAAWDAMLHSRFLAPRLLSVLPFYLSSSAYTEIQTHAGMRIPLPPNSSTPESGKKSNSAELNFRFDIEAAMDFKTLSTRSSNDKLNSIELTPMTIPTCAPLHLMRAVRIISKCKESIWTEYQKLYGDDPNVHPLKERPSQNTCRDEFELAWSNWHNDMMDRIGMRNTVLSCLSWQDPLHDLERPEWKLWRDGLGPIEAPDFSAIEQDDQVCRIVRAFVARKPAEQPSQGVTTARKPTEQPQAGTTARKPAEQPSQGVTMARKPADQPQAETTTRKPAEQPSQAVTTARKEQSEAGTTARKPAEQSEAGTTARKPAEQSQAARKPAEQPQAIVTARKPAEQPHAGTGKSSKI